jgi:hypothetical protein
VESNYLLKALIVKKKLLNKKGLIGTRIVELRKLDSSC